MDYSASIHEDHDDLAGQTGWGSPGSSPQRSARSTGIEPIAADATYSPFDQYHVPEPAMDDSLSSNTYPESFGPSEPEASADATTPQATEAGAMSGSQGLLSPSAQEPARSPLQQQRHNSQPSSPHVSRDAQTQQPRKPTQPQHKLQVKITGLERTGKKDPILRFDVHTNLSRYRTTQYRDVRRLHSEFVKLAEHLISANPEALVHAVPPPLTSAGAGTDEDEARVKALIQRWFNYTCSNEVLMKDDEMVLFVESDFGYSPMVKMKQPATGVRRKILKQFAPPPDDTPELEAARPTVKLFYLGTMDAGHKVDKLVKCRRGLSLAENEFGVKISNMHVQELHMGLANAYRKLGKIVQTVGDLHAAQATAEATTIGDPFQYHSQDAFIVKESLTNRQILIREFLQAQETMRNKLNAVDRLKASSNVRREKVDEAIAALEEARQNEAHLEAKTGRVTQNLVRERRRWFSQTAADLRLSVREFVLREIEAERRALALLESVRPDVRAIDSSGGLSRLGRESHPSIRRSSLAASQGPKGDAWSGVPRRSDAASRSASTTGTLIAAANEEDEERGVEAGTRSSIGSGLAGLKEEDDEDRLDARNAASRLAASTF